MTPPPANKLTRRPQTLYYEGVRPIGPHSLQLDGDLVWLRVHGAFTVADCEAVFAIVEKVLEQHGRFFLLGDLSQTEVMAAATRRWIADWSRVHGQPLGAAFYGAGLLVRTFAMMLHRATNLISSKTAPLFFGRTEQEALDWLAPLRQSAAPPKP